MAAIARAWRRTIEVVLPAHCVGCRRGGTYLCDSCIESMGDPGSESIDSLPFVFDQVRAVYAFGGVARTAVHQLKFRNLRALAPAMAQLMAPLVVPRSIDVIVPVPLHPSRLRERGYNQAELLAAGLARLTGVPLSTNALRRTKQASRQVEAASIEARNANVKDAFAANASVAELRVLAVDDVTTTGSTFNACASALKHAGALEVRCLAFARER